VSGVALPIGIVDYGAGNLVSIEQALEVVGAHPIRIASERDAAAVEALIVPGVGAAAPAMERLQAANLGNLILQWIADDRPFLGICLGLQLLFEGSDEDGAVTCGVLPGRTVRLREAPTLPHIGWNQVERTREHPAFDGIADGADFYFVHSYAGQPGQDARDAILAETEHGTRFVSAVAFGRKLGVQFHPERSGPDGLRLLSNFVRLAARTEVAA
jgi:imidazole glycerol phosphate synthase glutamine amidotransferase subunit